MYAALVKTQFDFRQKMATCVEQIRTCAAKIGSYGIVVGEDIIALVIMANLEWASAQTWGNEHRISLQAIRRKYPYDTAHDKNTTRIILKELAATNKMRDRFKATAPEVLRCRHNNEHLSWTCGQQQQ